MPSVPDMTLTDICLQPLETLSGLGLEIEQAVMGSNSQVLPNVALCLQLLDMEIFGYHKEGVPLYT
jgi:hypothetical protein